VFYKSKGVLLRSHKKTYFPVSGKKYGYLAAGSASAELPDKYIPILIYCQSGARAATAVKTLTRMGYDNVFSFGGILN